MWGLLLYLILKDDDKDDDGDSFSDVLFRCLPSNKVWLIWIIGMLLLIAPLIAILIEINFDVILLPQTSFLGVFTYITSIIVGIFVAIWFFDWRHDKR